MKAIILTILALLFLSACAQTAVKPYKFGVPVPLTGTNAFYGEYTRAGIDLAIEDINKAGGINGRPVQVIYEDTGGDKAKATMAAQKLVEIDDVDALITLLTSMGGAVAPVAEAAKIPFIYASATNSFTENKTYVFKDYPDSVALCELLMKQAKKDGHDKIAMFAVNGEQSQLCKKGAEKIEKFVLAEFYNIGESDFRTQLAKIKDRATAVFILALQTDCANAYKQMQELGVDVQLYIPAYQVACGTKDSVKAGGDLLKDAYGADIVLTEDSTDPAFLAFKARLESSPLLIGSAMMYDSAMEMAKAIQGCSDNLCVVSNLRNLNNYQGVSGLISYNGGQIVEREIALTHFEDGKWRRVE